MILETVIVGALETNCYILGCQRTGRAIVIDPGDDPNDILRVLSRHHLSIDRLVATHAHFDHLLSARPLQEIVGAPSIWPKRTAGTASHAAHGTTWIGCDSGTSRSAW
jgi:glyoxylase-like metal-dependent hydrolase (beta-lactamase superfamily II)